MGRLYSVSPASDFQRHRVYCLERGFTPRNPGRLSLTAARALAASACRRWRVPTVHVKFGRSEFWYGDYSEGEGITLYSAKRRKRPGHGQEPGTLLHEVAHHITHCRAPETPAHGAEFAAICLDLYDHYRVLPASCYRALAREYGVKVAKLRRLR